jgi:hypothetical protein
VFLVIGIDRKIWEDLSCLATKLRFIAGDGHVTDRAFVLNLRLNFRMIDDLAP